MWAAQRGDGGRDRHRDRRRVARRRGLRGARRRPGDRAGPGRARQPGRRRSARWPRPRAPADRRRVRARARPRPDREPEDDTAHGHGARPVCQRGQVERRRRAHEPQYAPDRRPARGRVALGTGRAAGLPGSIAIATGVTAGTRCYRYGAKSTSTTYSSRLCASGAQPSCHAAFCVATWERGVSPAVIDCAYGDELRGAGSTDPKIHALKV